LRYIFYEKKCILILKLIPNEFVFPACRRAGIEYTIGIKLFVRKKNRKKIIEVTTAFQTKRKKLFLKTYE
jgi:hypothetical protein